MLALVGAVVVGGAGPADAAPAYPAAAGRCVDRTGVLGAGRCGLISSILQRDEKATSDEIAVAIVPTTGDKSIEAWTTGLFNTWGVGKKSKNNGVLLVVAVDDHRVRLETGRGAAGRLTDGEAATIVDDVITPRFAEDDYLLGVLTGLDEVRRELGHAIPADARLASLAEEPDTEDDSTFVTNDDAFIDQIAEPDDSSVPAWPIGIGALGVVALIGFLISRASSGPATAGGGRRTRPVGPSSRTHRTTWVAGSSDTTSSSFSSSSDSGSSFGGGSSDGSGASGSW